MVKTIQVNDEVVEKLDSIKNNGKSYEDAILELIELANEKKKQELNKEQEELLIEGYKVMAGESLKICKEFEAIEQSVLSNTKKISAERLM